MALSLARKAKPAVFAQTAKETNMTAQARRKTMKNPLSIIPCLPVLVIAAMVLLPSSASIAMAQDIHLGLDFITSFPRGEFSNNLNANGYGVAGHGLYGIPRAPLGIGLEFVYLNYGSQERRDQLSPTIPDATVKVRTSNNIFASHLLLRLQPYRGSVQPYADGLLGFKYLYTRTSVKGSWGTGSIASSTNHDDWTLSYGAGGGVQILLYQERPQRQKKRPRCILLDGRLRYMRGSPADYLIPGAIHWKDGQAIYDIRRSRTDMLWTQLGVTFRF
jgi:hypothetical protein